jgi:hypothetical protein
LPPKAATKVTRTTFALIYTTSPITTLSAESTTVTDGKQLRLWVIVQIDDAEACVWVYVSWALAGDPLEMVTFLLTLVTVIGLI